mmetsp:Transcript_6906/g.17903  ORF Transcript_6906/g.17903 Transcript_6906/m.17903 type:complete len:226 (-) Transcript_6906:741-1418(-)
MYRIRSSHLSCCVSAELEMLQGASVPNQSPSISRRSPSSSAGADSLVAACCISWLLSLEKSGIASSSSSSSSLSSKSLSALASAVLPLTCVSFESAELANLLSLRATARLRAISAMSALRLRVASSISSSRPPSWLLRLALSCATSFSLSTTPTSGVPSQLHFLTVSAESRLPGFATARSAAMSGVHIGRMAPQSRRTSSKRSPSSSLNASFHSGSASAGLRMHK